ncbi:hypothetical protein LINGRAHAP2_LOCUS22201 [Linum grandiflorum]
MSGGVGPSADISLPKEQPESEQGHKLIQDHPPKSQQSTTSKKLTSSVTLLSFYQLNSLAAILILASSGLVPISDFAFVLFSFLYIFLLSKFAFPPLPKDPSGSGSGSSIVNKGKLFRVYVFISFLLGTLLPVAYILQGILKGDRDGIKAAAPHVFLLASQLFMEGVAMSPSSEGRFSLPVGIFVPVFYNSRRMFSLADWVRSEFEKSEGIDVGGGGGGERRLWFGRGLAVANMGFWGFNLFGFLLPVAVPICMKKYYSASLQIKASKD